MLVLHILCLRNIMFSGLQIHLHTYTINAVPFYVVWGLLICKRQYNDKTLTLRKSMYMRASGASDLRKLSHFHIRKLLFLSIFCWYFRYTLSVQMTCLSANMYRQISKCTDKTLKKHYWGAIIAPLPPPPPPPSGYANGRVPSGGLDTYSLSSQVRPPQKSCLMWTKWTKENLCPHESPPPPPPHCSPRQKNHI